SLSRSQTMSRKKFRGTQAFTALTLDGEQPERAWQAADEDAVLVCLKNGSGRRSPGRTLDNLCLPHFKKLRLGLGWHSRKGTRPGNQAPDTIPKRSRGLRPVYLSILSLDFRSKANPICGLGTRRDL